MGEIGSVSEEEGTHLAIENTCPTSVKEEMVETAEILNDRPSRQKKEGDTRTLLVNTC